MDCDSGCCRAVVVVVDFGSTVVEAPVAPPWLVAVAEPAAAPPQLGVVGGDGGVAMVVQSVP